ncbi:hypothetical protein Tco_1264035 [Tanacetum coccineum]
MWGGEVRESVIEASEEFGGGEGKMVGGWRRVGGKSELRQRMSGGQEESWDAGKVRKREVGRIVEAKLLRVQDKEEDKENGVVVCLCGGLGLK